MNGNEFSMRRIRELKKDMKFMRMNFENLCLQIMSEKKKGMNLQENI
jgi:hypothetical protein